MHQFRRFIQERMDANGWSRSDLARRSGLKTQHISDLLSDDRDVLDRMPARTTVSALAQAFQVPEALVLQQAAGAYGVPVDEPVKMADPSLAGDEDLLREVARRMGSRSGKLTMPRLSDAQFEACGEVVARLDGLTRMAQEAGLSTVAHEMAELVETLSRELEAQESASTREG